MRPMSTVWPPITAWEVESAAENRTALTVPVWVVPTGSDEPETLVRAHPGRILRDLHELPDLLREPRGLAPRSP